MRYREIGKTGLRVSEIGFGAEWLERHTKEEAKEMIDRAGEYGINILDCWMSNPEVRSNIGYAIKGNREHWIIQGHLGSTWQNGQYTRTRELEKVKVAFNDLLERLGTTYIDLGMIHYVDSPEEFESIIRGDFYEYASTLKKDGAIRHIGLGTHNPAVAKKAAESGKIEMILFSINPAFDMLPANDNLDSYFAKETYGDVGGINPERSELYRICEENNIGITVMKGFAGGRLFDAKTSPFDTPLTPVQCIHYALTRPAVSSILVGFDSVKHIEEAVHYEDATEEEKDYASVLANAPKHAYSGECTYCGHCAPCPKGIDIAMVNKLSDLAKMHDEVPSSLKDHYSVMKANGSDCISCRQCESRCPFGVKVAEKMKEAERIFG